MLESRPVEFRAWHKELKKWVYFTPEDAFHNTVYSEGRKGFWIINDPSVLENETIYTGLKDKNGNEILTIKESDLRKILYQLPIHRRIHYKGVHENIVGNLNLELSEGDVDRIMDAIGKNNYVGVTHEN